MQSATCCALLVAIFLANRAQAIGAFSKMMTAGPSLPFTSSVLSRSLEAPEGIQLLSVSVLLLVFAVLATEQHDQTNGNDQTKVDEKSSVKLLRADHFAFRLGIMACLCGFGKVIPSSPSEGLNPIAATVEASEGIQFLSFAVLLLVFAVAVCSADLGECEQKSQEIEEKKQVQLLKVDAIAFRSGIVTCLLGLASLRAGFHCFLPTLTSLETPEGVQYLTASLLLLVFAVLVLDSKEEQNEGKTQVELLKVETIAFRCALAAAFLGVSQILTTLRLAVNQAFQAGQEGFLLLMASALLLVLARTLRCTLNVRELEEIQKEELKLKGATHVQLWRPDTVTYRAAVMTGLTGLLKATSNTEIPGLALSGEISLVVLSATAVALCK